MSDGKEYYVPAGCLIGAVGFFMIVLALSLATCNSWWERAAVKHGAAEHNQTTGAWQWKDELERNGK